MKKSLSTLIILLIFLPLTALESDYTFGRLSLSDGLNNGTIYSLLEDHKGFLWIGSESGLSCYDGFKTHGIIDGSNNKDQLFQWSINRLQEDAAHNIWASGYNGCYIIDKEGKLIYAAPKLQELGLYRNNSFQVYPDKQGNLWTFYSDSLLYLNYNTGEIRSYTAPMLKSVGQHLSSISETDNELYIVNGDRFLCFNKRQESWDEVELPTAMIQSSKNLQVFNFMRCYCDKQGGLWLFSLFTEDIAYRPSKGLQWQQIIINTNKKNHRSQNSIRDILEDSEGNIWIATDHEGLYLFRRDKGIIGNFRHKRSEQSTLAGDNINCLMLDSHNTMWVGHFKSGISYHNPKYNLIKHYATEVGEVTALIADKDGSRWIGTDGQVLIHELADHTLVHQEKLNGITITSLLIDNAGALWVGTYNHGLFRIYKNQFTHFSQQQGMLPHDNVTRMVFDAQERLWICSTFGSFYRFDTQTHQYEIVRQNGEKDLQGLSLCYDPVGKIHMGSVWGLWSNDVENLTGERRLGLSDNRNFVEEQFQSLYADSVHNYLWMAHRQGITVWDVPNDTLYELSSGANDQSHQVFSICPDLEGNIWFNTNEGLSVVTPTIKNNGICHFKVSSITAKELQQPQYTFNTFASAMTPEGNLLFGCSDGYCEIDPKAVLAISTTTPSPTFLAIRYNERFLTESDLKMWHHNNFPLQLSFFSGNPLDASSIRYSYRIKGISDIWQDINGNQLDISNLPWGKQLEIQVRACDTDGVWSEPQSLFITTDMPISRTPLLFAIYTLILAAGVGIVCRIVWVNQRRKSLRRHRQQLHEQQAKLNREKLQQMNILFENLQKEQLKAQEYIEQLKAQTNSGNEVIVDKVSSINAADEDFIQKCISISEKNISDSNFGVEELGQIIGMSRSQLYKRFMAITGKSPLDVIRSVRMKRAKQLFENTQLSCGEIAQLVGYNTLKTFTENFKQEYGMTPSEYQRTLD